MARTGLALRLRSLHNRSWRPSPQAAPGLACPAWGLATRFSSHRWVQSAAGIPPDMPDNLRQIMDDYVPCPQTRLDAVRTCFLDSHSCLALSCPTKERRRAEEDANQSAMWRIVNSTTGAVVGAALAGGIVFLLPG